MSTVFQSRGIKFKINPRDHNPPHVHVEGYGCSVRINLLTFEQMNDTDFSMSDLKRICEAVRVHQAELMAMWKEYHGEE